METKVGFKGAVETKRSGDGNEAVFPRGSRAGMETSWTGLGNEAEEMETKNEVLVSMSLEWLAGVSEHRQGACFIMGDAVRQADRL